MEGHCICFGNQNTIKKFSSFLLKDMYFTVPLELHHAEVNQINSRMTDQSLQPLPSITIWSLLAPFANPGLRGLTPLLGVGGRDGASTISLRNRFEQMVNQLVNFKGDRRFICQILSGIIRNLRACHIFKGMETLIITTRTIKFLV